MNWHRGDNRQSPMWIRDKVTPKTQNPLPFLVSGVRNGGEADKKVQWTFLSAERIEQREGPGKQKNRQAFLLGGFL